MSVLETVTVVFTDLVGSTGLATRVGPGTAEELRREIKNTGDGTMLVFGSSSAAVAATKAMQQRFEQRNRHADEQLLVRIGISLGEAHLEDGDYFGGDVESRARELLETPAASASATD